MYAYIQYRPVHTGMYWYVQWYDYYNLFIRPNTIIINLSLSSCAFTWISRKSSSMNLERSWQAASGPCVASRWMPDIAYLERQLQTSCAHAAHTSPSEQSTLSTQWCVPRMLLAPSGQQALWLGTCSEKYLASLVQGCGVPELACFMWTFWLAHTWNTAIAKNILLLMLASWN